MMMTMPGKKTKAAGLMIVLLITSAALLFLFGILRLRKDEKEKITDIVCALEVKCHDDTTRALVTGYNYALLKLFAEQNGIGAEIFLSKPGENYLDSLASSVDIVVRPFPDGVAQTWPRMSIPVDSLSVWVTNPENKRLGALVDKWIEAYPLSEEYRTLHTLYTDNFHNPFSVRDKGMVRKFLSPYDDIIKANASELGWDWRLLAALIYQESRFRIDATSPKGAIGLMQMIPSTADRYDIEDILSPVECINAGTEHLRYIKYIFHRRCRDSEDLRNVTLAAYNAGIGHLKDCFYYLNWKGNENPSWEDIVSIMPEMSDESILQVDTVKTGKFKSSETLEYVRRVLEYYDVFREICPDGK